MEPPKKTDPSAVVVPFGKHKGATVAEMLAKDPQYADWVMAQGWVAERFAELHAAIATRGAGTDDTPEHNALQARFLDERFRDAFFVLAAPGVASAFKESLNEKTARGRESVVACHRAVERYTQEILEREKEGWGVAYVEERKAQSIKELATHQRYLDECIAAAYELKTKVVFEQRGVDVLLYWRYVKSGVTPQFIVSGFDAGAGQLSVELKPAIGDDYPSVMRQMQRLGVRICVIGQYTGRGVSEIQLRQMFEANGHTLVFVQEIEEESRRP